MYPTIGQILLSIVVSGISAANSPLLFADRRNDNRLQTIREFKPDGCYFERIYVNPKRRDMGLISVGNGNLQGFDLRSGKKTWAQQLTNFNSRSFAVPRIRTMAFASTGQWVFVGGTEYLGKLETSTGDVDTVYGSDNPDDQSQYTAIGLSPDDQLLIATGSKEAIQINFDINAIGLSPQHLQRAQAVHEQVVQVWSTQSGKLLCTASVNDAYIREVGVSKNRLIMYTASYRRIAFFRLADLKEIAVIDATDLQLGNPSNLIMSTALSHDFRFVAISTLSNIYLVATESQRVVSNFGQLSGSEAGIAGIARHIDFTDSDSVIAATDLNGRFYSWEIASGRMLTYGFSPRGDMVWSSSSNPHPLVAFDPDRQFALEPMPFTAENPCPGFRMIRLH